MCASQVGCATVCLLPCAVLCRTVHCCSGTYKIPTANDIPIDFRVSLLQNTPNPRAVHSSKAVGEPPFHLGAAVFFALKDAVYAAREAAGHKGWFRLDAPATPEKLRMACADELTAAYAPADLQPLMSC